jgi:hypothetical protein
MPVGVVKTAHDEELWTKAKKAASDQGRAKDWAYVMGIFKKMKGEGAGSHRDKVMAFVDELVDETTTTGGIAGIDMGMGGKELGPKERTPVDPAKTKTPGDVPGMKKVDGSSTSEAAVCGYCQHSREWHKFNAPGVPCTYPNCDCKGLVEAVAAEADYKCRNCGHSFEDHMWGMGDEVCQAPDCDCMEYEGSRPENEAVADLTVGKSNNDGSGPGLGDKNKPSDGAYVGPPDDGVMNTDEAKAFDATVDKFLTKNEAYNFTKSAKVGKWEVHYDPAAHYGYFEHDEAGEGGGLWFEGSKLVDFDGVFVLPKDVVKAIQQLGLGFDGPAADYMA